jgi:serine/threonine protein kinase
MTRLTDIYRIDNFIDTFALGHYARVLDAVDSRTGQTVAFKVMRTEHLNGEPEIRWEYRAFGSEADLLSALKDSPNIVQLLDCGYVETESEAPSGGDIESFGLNVGDFRVALPEFAARRWRPYLALENLPRTANLLYLMKPSQQNTRWRLPTEEGLALALQFAQLLQLAHNRGIVYLDHKLEHLYWDGAKLRLIDLNSSRRVDARTSESQYLRMDIHNLCVGILYPVFTGLSPLKSTLRPQPSSQSEVENRYRDITRLDFGIEPSLSPALQDLLQRGAALEIDTIDDFLHDLRAVCARHGWDFSDQYTIPASRDGRDHMRAGLRKLREGQESLREARDIFRDAAVQDGISEDLEAELRRLVIAANHMLNGRVIP